LLQIVISIDESTAFLFGIIEKLKARSIPCNVIEIHPTQKSYDNGFKILSELDKKSFILFLGHGQSDKLYGGEDLQTFPKKPFIKLKEMNIFCEQNLFLLSCNSRDLIKSSFRIARMNRSIGFGALPTSKEEVEQDNKLKERRISLETIEEFKLIMVETISESITMFYDKSFNKLKDYLILLIDKKINYAILDNNNSNLAELLFKMRNEIVLY